MNSKVNVKYNANLLINKTKKIIIREFERYEKDHQYEIVLK